ncbi:MAG: hypothetical protein AB8B86_09660 [Pseudomonadales bacterium]
MAEKDAIKSVQEHIHHETRNNIVINLVLNAAIAYALMHSLTEISAWGEKGYGPDLLLTGFLLSTILGGIFIVMTRRKRDDGQLVPAGKDGQILTWLFPYRSWLAAPWMGVLGACLAVPPLLGILALFSVSTLSPLNYALIKGVWAGALAAVVVPIAIQQGLRSKPGARYP